jgi:hypothetical protein
VESSGALEITPVVTGDGLIISRLVFARFVLITAHAKNIDANRQTTANKPVWPGFLRRIPVVVSYMCMIFTP